MKSQLLEKMAYLEKEISQCEVHDCAHLVAQHEVLFSYYHGYLNN